jgi:hypothetical protein
MCGEPKFAAQALEWEPARYGTRAYAVLPKGAKSAYRNCSTPQDQAAELLNITVDAGSVLVE